ncbi:hypothetical protein NC651_020956 [Populus alba x Populus x berolinensis]|nr:hypothetical protein NC651_020956 [Populus alba x Populus x berolinensis]
MDMKSRDDPPPPPRIQVNGGGEASGVQEDCSIRGLLFVTELALCKPSVFVPV